MTTTALQLVSDGPPESSIPGGQESGAPLRGVTAPALDAECRATIGAVAIGRNEGERLRRCLQSLVDRVGQVVYVDSGSTDGSVELAESLGVHVVNLDLSRPFTAARARNEGIAALREIAARTEFVQVIDGDCAVIDGWLEAAWRTINKNERTAIVCGRRRERFPDSTIYNRLCDMEWDGSFSHSLFPLTERRSCSLWSRTADSGSGFDETASRVEIQNRTPVATQVLSSLASLLS